MIKRSIISWKHVEVVLIMMQNNRRYLPSSSTMTNRTKPSGGYTRQDFVFNLLNRALRLLESDTIVDMGLFIHDLQRQMAQFHDHPAPPLTLDRERSLFTDDFQNTKTNQNGLMVFNSVLPSSKDRSISLQFAEGALSTPDTVEILFTMTVNPKIRTLPCANIQQQNLSKTEVAHFLFSLNSV